MLSAAVRKTHATTLEEWADLYERTADVGDSETSFLLRRAARHIRRGAGEAVAPEPAVKAADTPEVAEG